MSNINNIYTTISNGRTHIAADKIYIDSVNSYNNFFTKFFACLFQCSMAVNFDGKIRSVNKKSYLKLISRLTSEDVKIERIRDYYLFRDVAKKVDFTNLDKTMREAISDKDRRHLFYKLAQAISSGNTDKALKMIGKGAALDIEYYDRGKIKPSFISDTSNLSPEKAYKFTVFKGTPILVAAKKCNNVVVQRLKEFGANINLTATEYVFERKITGVSRHYNLVCHPSVYHGYGGHTRTTSNYHLEEYTIVHTKDDRPEPKKKYKLDEKLNLIEA